MCPFTRVHLGYLFSSPRPPRPEIGQLDSDLSLPKHEVHHSPQLLPQPHLRRDFREWPLWVLGLEGKPPGTGILVNFVSSVLLDLFGWNQQLFQANSKARGCRKDGFTKRGFGWCSSSGNHSKRGQMLLLLLGAPTLQWVFLSPGNDWLPQLGPSVVYFSRGTGPSPKKGWGT